MFFDFLFLYLFELFKYPDGQTRAACQIDYFSFLLLLLFLSLRGFKNEVYEVLSFRLGCMVKMRTCAPMGQSKETFVDFVCYIESFPQDDSIKMPETFILSRR